MGFCTSCLDLYGGGGGVHLYGPEQTTLLHLPCQPMPCHFSRPLSSAARLPALPLMLLFMLGRRWVEAGSAAGGKPTTPTTTYSPCHNYQYHHLSPTTYLPTWREAVGFWYCVGVDGASFCSAYLPGLPVTHAPWYCLDRRGGDWWWRCHHG